jgi:enoyl-CoA hydratase/carnithine racemase
MNFETLNVNREGAVMFAEIAAPPMNLLGPELVRDLVSLIQQAEADDSRFCSRVPTPTISFPTST